MKKTMTYCLMLLVAIAVASCKDKKKDDLIIVSKPAAEQKQETRSTGGMQQEKTVSWAGARYTVKLSLKADPTLDKATDGVADYYDNRATLTILRPDGTTFLERSFTKADFKNYVDNAFYKDGALLAIVFDKVEAGNLKFAVTVGNPDKASDEFVPLELSVSPTGGVTIKKIEDVDEE